MHPNGHIKYAERLDRLIEIDGVFFQLDPFLVQCLKDIVGGHSPERLVVLPDVQLEGDRAA